MTNTRSDAVYGRNPVYEVLRAGRRAVHHLLVDQRAKPQGRLADVVREAHLHSIDVRYVDRAELDSRAQNHQGVLAIVGGFPYVAVEAMLSLADQRNEPPLVLALDQVQDPQNFGTLIRTAEAVGVHGIIIPRARAVGITPAVVSASAGACEHCLIATENLDQAIRTLKAGGLWVAGLEQGPEARDLGEVDWSGPVMLVVGSEGTGLRALVRRRCDFTVEIPMRGRIDSLNAAVAGSVVLYAIWAARGYAGARPGRGGATPGPEH